MSDYYGGAELTPEQERAAWRDTYRVLDEVATERGQQRARYGLNRDLEDGTGPSVRWLMGPGSANLDMYPADEIEQVLRESYLQRERVAGKPTWMHLVREEVAEAFAEADPVRLREELLQVAALAVSWIETLDDRAGQCGATLSTKSYTHVCDRPRGHQTPHQAPNGITWTSSSHEKVMKP